MCVIFVHKYAYASGSIKLQSWCVIRTANSVGNRRNRLSTRRRVQTRTGFARCVRQTDCRRVVASGSRARYVFGSHVCRERRHGARQLGDGGGTFLAGGGREEPWPWPRRSDGRTDGRTFFAHGQSGGGGDRTNCAVGFSEQRVLRAQAHTAVGTT